MLLVNGALLAAWPTHQLRRRASWPYFGPAHLVRRDLVDVLAVNHELLLDVLYGRAQGFEIAPLRAK
ncbi:MAG: hypothetical protein O2884_11095 [Chloroflexi bacterium]|nr:hypothetical protein [Chloroflexota bacterium]